MKAITRLFFIELERKADTGSNKSSTETSAK